MTVSSVVRRCTSLHFARSRASAELRPHSQLPDYITGARGHRADDDAHSRTSKPLFGAFIARVEFIATQIGTVNSP